MEENKTTANAERESVQLNPDKSYSLKEGSVELYKNLLNQSLEKIKHLEYVVSKLENTYAIERMNFLFKILENQDSFNDELIDKVVVEIDESLFPSKK